MATTSVLKFGSSVLASPDAFWSRVHPDDAQVLLEALDQGAPGRTWEGEFRARAGTGQPWLWLRARAVAQDRDTALVWTGVILDATASKNGYTKHELLRAAGIPVKVENWGGKMHMKSAVIDGQYIITGSMNWTSAGEGGNDENTVIIKSEKMARQYEKYFQKVWDSISDKWLEGRPDPESMNSAAACFDDVDNDFDHLADAEDDGCGETPPSLPPLPPHWFVSKASGEGKLIKGETRD